MIFCYRYNISEVLNSFDGRTLVVEVNDGYALGNYGLSPLNSINFHKARWKEMVKPYFEKNDVFTMPEMKI